MFEEAFRVLLPHGLYDEAGVCHREAWLRPLTGWDEVSFGRGAHRTALDIAASHVVRIGGFVDPDEGLVAELPCADLAQVCLALRAHLLGDEVVLVVACRNPSCQELSHLDFRVSDAAPPRAHAAPRSFRVDTPAGPATLREPTGNDERAAREAGGGASGAIVLLSRVVLDLSERGPLAPDAFAALAPGVRHAIAAGLAEQSVAPDLTFFSRCPACSARFSVRVDPARLLGREVALGEDRLLSEVATLAFHYHWTEADILSQPRTRRWKYLDALGRQLRGEPLGEGWA